MGVFDDFFKKAKSVEKRTRPLRIKMGQAQEKAYGKVSSKISPVAKKVKNVPKALKERDRRLGISRLGEEGYKKAARKANKASARNNRELRDFSTRKKRLPRRTRARASKFIRNLF
jgi:hypothetical protein